MDIPLAARISLTLTEADSDKLRRTASYILVGCYGLAFGFGSAKFVDMVGPFVFSHAGERFGGVIVAGCLGALAAATFRVWMLFVRVFDPTFLRR